MSSGALALGALLALSLAGAATADPCDAIPDRGPMPAYLSPGAGFSGPVVYVGDGDGLCVDVGAIAKLAKGGHSGISEKSSAFTGSTWVEVRLADFYAPELHEAGGAQAKAALERIAKGRAVSCVADHRSYDRVVAVCQLQGRSLGDLMRASGVREAGRGW